jgi:hypothetical protein
MSTKSDETSSSVSSGPIQLEYSQGNPWWNSRGFKRLVGTVVLIALGAVGWRFGPHAYRFVQMRYWQSRCMEFQAPPGTVVYTRLPPGSSKPALTAGYEYGDDPTMRAIQGPAFILQAPKTRDVLAYQVPRCWTRFLKFSGNTTAGNVPSAVLFCHELVSRSGNKRLVTLELARFTGEIADLCGSDARVYPTAGWGGCVQLNRRTTFGYAGSALPLPTRIFAGQTDPADPSHFTIEFEWRTGVRGAIDGHLRDDDSIDLEARPGPGDFRAVRSWIYQDSESWETDSSHRKVLLDLKAKRGF